MERANYFDRLASTAGQEGSLEEYWINKLSGDLVKTGFPFDNIKLNSNSDDRLMEEARFQFTADDYERLMKLSSGSYPRLHMILIAGLVSLLFKYSSNTDIIVGTSIYKQEIEGEFINTILVLRLHVQDNTTFKELLLQVRQILSEAVANQNYPIELLLQKLGIPFSKTDDFPLFDVAVLLENIQDRTYIRHINPNMSLIFSETGGALEGSVYYNTIVYNTENIKRICNRFKQLLHQVLLNIDLPLVNIDVLTDEEKRTLLLEFNDTEREYPAHESIIDLFQQQVEKKPDHIAVVHSDNHTAYKELAKQSHRLAMILRNKGAARDTIVGVIADPSPELIVGILGILKAGAAYLPIDPESPSARVEFILKDSDAGIVIATGSLTNNWKATGWEGEKVCISEAITWGRDGETPSEEIHPHPQVLVNESFTAMAYLIYTSGTTGKPKGVIIDHQGLVNYIWWAIAQYVKNEARNFPLFTSIAFDLTITSIFSPLITGNAVVVYGNDGEDNALLIEKIIAENKVEAVKLTPSHLSLIREKRMDASPIKCFIVGGEKLDTSLAADISQHFKDNIEIYNEYGPTETVVGCMCYRFNRGIDTGRSVSIGIPISNMQVYILDIYYHPVPLGAAGELYVAGDGVARGYLNNPELTNEKFKAAHELHEISRIKVLNQKLLPGSSEGSAVRNRRRQKYYRTGDLARWLPDGNIEFLGRIDHQVKIRGFRIEPAEIEYRLKQQKEIEDALVVVREYATGDNYLTAYLVTAEKSPGQKQALDINELRNNLSMVLPDYMIPAYFVMLAQFPLTSNGKIDRKALPQPEFAPDSDSPYSPPRTRIEKQLVEIWSSILGIEGSLIGIDSNFFQLGGHSLKAILMVSEIHKQLNLRVTLKDVFAMPSIRSLAELLKTLDKDIHIPIPPASAKDNYVLSSAQKRIYVAQQVEVESTSYNVSMIVVLWGELDREKLELNFRELIRRHESLRTSFIMLRVEPAQKIHDKVEFDIEYFDLSPNATLSNSRNLKDINDLVNQFKRPFDLSHAPLMRVGVVKLEPEKHLLMLDMHHMISDGISLGIFIRDFAGMYSGQPLPPLNIRYVDFSEWQNQWLYSPRMNEQEEYWLGIFKENIPVVNLPTDFPRPTRRSNEDGDTIQLDLREDLTTKLKRTARENETTLFMVLLAIFNILLAKYGKTEDIVVGTPVTGRSHPDLQDVIGVFINMIVLRNDAKKEKTFREFLREVRNNTIAAFENQDYPFDQLVNRLGIERTTGRNPLFDFEFSMNIMDVETIDIPGLKIEPYKNEIRFAKYDMHLLILDEGPIIRMILRYSTALFKRFTMEKIMDYYVEIAEQVVAQEDILLRNIKISHTLASTTSAFAKEKESDFLL